MKKTLLAFAMVLVGVLQMVIQRIVLAMQAECRLPLIFSSHANTGIGIWHSRILEAYG